MSDGVSVSVKLNGFDRGRAPEVTTLPAYAFFSAAMSSFIICIMAFIARSARVAFLSAIILGRISGVICQNMPNLSLTQPHGICSPPFEVSFRVYVSISLRLASDGQRHAHGERERVAPVERHVLLPGELELHGHHAPLGAGAGVAVARDFTIFDGLKIET